MGKKQRGVPAQPGYVERIGHQQEDVYIIRVNFAGYERPEDHEPRQVAARLRYAINAHEAKSQRLALVGADAEAIENFMEWRWVHAKR